ncbi:MAG: hypothetical protein ACOCV8_03910 [Spirochaetota bacterium]
MFKLYHKYKILPLSFILLIYIIFFAFCDVSAENPDETTEEDKDALKHPLTDVTTSDDGLYTGYTFADTVEEHSGDEIEGFSGDKAVNGVRGEGKNAGSLDVFVIGEAEYTILSWSGKKIINGEGNDIKVFENGFYMSGSDAMSLDLGLVEVSKDGVNWKSIPVKYDDDVQPNKAEGKKNFVGTTPVYINMTDEELIHPATQEAGGDAFDLSDAGIEEGDYIKYIKIIDAGNKYPDGQVESNGVDIDGVCAFYWENE